jgi:SAM-dependent methyltransferase
MTDVPSPINLRSLQDAREWEQTANTKRPWRTAFFARFADELKEPAIPVRRVLELGSGPGFLSRYLLETYDSIDYTLLDFSAAMHGLARARLIEFAERTHFIERNFRDPGWYEGLGQFDAVITHQAVHELRHKRYAADLHARVRLDLLAPGGCYLMCDHYAGEDGMADHALYMTPNEQRKALLKAGFGHVTLCLKQQGLALHRAA